MNKWSKLPPLEVLVNDISFQGCSQDFDFGEHDFEEWLIMCLLSQQSPCKYAATRKLVFEASLKSWRKAIWTRFLTPPPNQAVNWCMFGISRQSTVILQKLLSVAFGKSRWVAMILTYHQKQLLCYPFISFPNICYWVYRLASWIAFGWIIGCEFTITSLCFWSIWTRLCLKSVAVT